MLLMQLQLCSSQQQAPAQHALCGSAAKDAAVQKYLTAGRQVGAAQNLHQRSLMMVSHNSIASRDPLSDARCKVFLCVHTCLCQARTKADAALPSSRAAQLRRCRVQ